MVVSVVEVAMTRVMMKMRKSMAITITRMTMIEVDTPSCVAYRRGAEP